MNAAGFDVDALVAYLGANSPVAPPGPNRFTRQRVNYDSGMELNEFVVGEAFWTEAGQFRGTDVGSRVVIAIKLGPTEVMMVDDSGETFTRLDEDPSWFDGPP